MNWVRLTNEKEVQDLIGYHNQRSSWVCIDIETTSKEPRKASLLDVQLGGKEEDDVVIFDAKYVKHLESLRNDILLVAHNYRYDSHVLVRCGIDLTRYTWRDTLIMGRLLDENRDSYSLDSYVKERWGDSYKEDFWSKNKDYQSAPRDEADTYAMKDILYTARLYREFSEQLKSEGIPDTLVEHVHKLQDALLTTEILGLQVDLDYLQELGVTLKKRINELHPKMRELVKDELDLLELKKWQEELDKRKTEKGKAGVQRPVFSFDSTKQLSTLLYGVLELPVQRNEKTKAISTDFDSLEKIKGSHPLIELIQENRELQKVFTSYVEGTLDRLDQTRIYPEFSVAGSVTGRIAHYNPNLAQLPKSGGVRGIYVPDRGRRLIAADYSQLEVIIEANLTADKNLIRMLENGESKHDLTARELGCDRSTAKTLNFCLQYWGSHFKVAKLLNCSIDEALKIWTKYWLIYEGPKKLKARTDSLVNNGKYLETCFGRRRRFPHRKRSPWDSNYRQAYNFLIQGTGADITSRAFYLISEKMEKRGWGRALFTVHDEILIEVKEEFVEEANNELITTMEEVGNYVKFQVPLKSESSGPTIRWVDK